MIYALPGMRFLIVIAVAVGLASFGTWGVLPSFLNGSDPQAAQQSDSDRLQELRRLIEKEIGTPSADEATQCKLIAFGSKTLWRSSDVFGLFDGQNR
jgi:hypothetical protein